MRALIEKYAPTLDLKDEEVDRSRLLAALCLAESNGGRNWQPNYEPAFFIGGRYWNDRLAELVNYWGQGADPVMRPWCEQAVACSWGPFQILYITAVELKYDGPPWGLTDPATCLRYAVRLINKRIIPKLVHDTPFSLLAQIAGRYNAGGNWKGLAAKQYIAKVTAHYTSAISPLHKLVTLPDT